MAYCIRKKKKKYKNKVYQYYELVKTYRDPNNKKRVISDFKAHLGKDRDQIKGKLERYKQESTGHYSPDRLMKSVERGMKEFEEGKSNLDFSPLQ